MSTPVDLRQSLRNLQDLPAFPVIAQKLLALNLDSEQGEQQMMLLIAQDAGEILPLAHIIHITEKLIPLNGLYEPVGCDVSAEEWIALGIDPATADAIAAQAQEQAEQAVQCAITG